MKIFHVDAFTDKPFSGNPAAVCISTLPRDDMWMQDVAKEMNLSETAFLVAQEDRYSLRWFTPKVEVDLCGHATLASAHVLWETHSLRLDEKVRFSTRSGLLTCTRKGVWIEMDLPSKPEEEVLPPENLIRALGTPVKYVGKSQFDYIVEVESEGIVRNLKPDFDLLLETPARGVIVTSIASSRGLDFVSRFFAPAVGVNEDPVTGSAHCCLGPFWKRRLNKDNFTAYQASERGGVLKVLVSGNRVYLSGQAVTVTQGELLI
jgi:PhzF family phenazine biosynthesis protein